MSSGKKLTGTASSRVPPLKTADGSNVNVTGITVTASSTRNGNAISPETNTAKQELFARPSNSTTATLAATKIGSGNWTFTKDQSGNYILPENARRELTDSSSQFSRNINGLATNTAKNVEFADGNTKFKLSDSQVGEVFGRNAAQTGAATESTVTASSEDAVTVESVTTLERKPTKNYGTLKYPIKAISGDFIKFELLEYKKSGLASDQGKLATSRIDDRVNTVNGTVYLPIQSGIVDNCSVDWGQGDLNPITAQFAAAAYSTISAAGGGLSPGLQQFGSSISDILKNFGSNAPELRPMLINYFTEQAVGTQGLLSRTLGGAINNNIELLFNGPTLRSFTFTFRLTPREPGESLEIKKIIRLFKTEMHPQLSESELYLLTPNVFKLSYKQFFGDSSSVEKDHEFLNRIKICALKDFSVNYTPDGSYMTYNGDGAMTAYELSMTFAEISPIYREDYIENAEGLVGMGW